MPPYCPQDLSLEGHIGDTLDDDNSMYSCTESLSSLIEDGEVEERRQSDTKENLVSK